MSEKKSNIFARAAKAVGTYFRELKSELKKVVWPSGKQVRNNTLIVIVAVILVGVLVALLDLGFSALFNLFLK